MMQIGLPAPSAGETSRVAVGNGEFDPAGVIGSTGSHMYLLARSGSEPDLRWWFVGIEVRNGSPLFAPVDLGSSARPPRCFLNGHEAIVCLYDDYTKATAYIIDAGNGQLTYNGPSEVRLAPGELTATQAGSYLVASTPDQGVFGVGPQAQTTWFVPGNGSLSGTTNYDLAAQSNANPSIESMTVFNLADGSPLHLDIPDGARVESVVMLSDGLAAEIATGQSAAETYLFDSTGRRTSADPVSGKILSIAGDLLIIGNDGDQWSVLTEQGERLLQINEPPPHGSRRVGANLFVNESDQSQFPSWRRFDLKSGRESPGPTCDFDMGRRLLGTHGDIAVLAVTNPKAGYLAKAWNLTTCEPVWSLPSAVDSLARLWQIDGVLVALSADGTELYALDGRG
ncbi:MAG: hypothetical protein PGN27_15550 [Mycolicibacterium neoaurum]|uniref:hypothetical protein n=1 Tax=Mycolicibacterium neoaurum TaxID=1795 RepID=UPI002FFCB007